MEEGEGRGCVCVCISVSCCWTKLNHWLADLSAAIGTARALLSSSDLDQL